MTTENKIKVLEARVAKLETKLREVIAAVNEPIVFKARIKTNPLSIERLQSNGKSALKIKACGS